MYTRQGDKMLDTVVNRAQQQWANGHSLGSIRNPDSVSGSDFATTLHHQLRFMGVNQRQRFVNAENSIRLYRVIGTRGTDIRVVGGTYRVEHR